MNVVVRKTNLKLNIRIKTNLHTDIRWGVIMLITVLSL